MNALPSLHADPAIQAREQARMRFALTTLAQPSLALFPASSDASFRSYWRASVGDQTFIVMDAPPAQEDIAPFLNIAEKMRRASVRVPEILAHDALQGFMLLEDFGTQLLLPALSPTSVEHHYQRALDVAAQMALSVDSADLPRYDAARLNAEMDLLPNWFVNRHLGITMSAAECALFAHAKAVLIEAALTQPQGFVHRDFHSRNLMLLPADALGIIDFQDAVRGPICYDAVSLLKDCYIEWPSERVAHWREGYRLRLVANGVEVTDPVQFAQWFDFIGIQRHLKVLGIFARLHYRDGKSNYLNDLPLVLRYVLDASRLYPALQPLASWLERVIGTRDLTVAR